MVLLHPLLRPHSSLIRRCCRYSRFTDEETEAWGDDPPSGRVESGAGGNRIQVSYTGGFWSAEISEAAASLPAPLSGSQVAASFEQLGDCK